VPTNILAWEVVTDESFGILDVNVIVARRNRICEKIVDKLEYSDDDWMETPIALEIAPVVPAESVATVQIEEYIMLLTDGEL